MKQYLSKAAYQRKYKLSYPTVTKMVANGQVEYMTTETGQVKILDSEAESSPELKALAEQVSYLLEAVQALCKQFNTPLPGNIDSPKAVFRVVRGG